MDLIFDEIVERGNRYLGETAGKAAGGVMPKSHDNMSPAEQKADLETIAAAISQGHAGYPFFDEESKKKFETRIEKIYNNVSKITPSRDFMKIVNGALKALPDKHLGISDAKGNNPFYESVQGQAGTNHALRNGDSGKRYELSSMEKDGRNVGIIALPKAGISDLKELESFVDEVKNHLFDSNRKEKFDDLVIDIRGNEGGSALAFEYLARTLYGNEVRAAESSSYRDTRQADILRYIGNEMRDEEFKNRLENHKYTNESITDYDLKDYKSEYPAFANGGFQKPFQVLMDRNTASAAESMYPMLRNHPGVTFVGENSSGCYTEISGEKKLPTLSGYEIKIATRHNAMPREYGATETIGFRPDFNSNGEDALEYVKKNLQDIVENSQEKIDGCERKTMAPEYKNQVSITDAQYVRALRDGMDEDKVGQLYAKLNPEPRKMQKFDYLKQESQSGNKSLDQSVYNRMKADKQK